MRRLLAKTVQLCCLSLALMLPVPPALADAYIAEGRYQARLLELATDNPLVPRLIVNAEVSYRYSALMGEPLANHGLKWELVGFTLVPGKGREIQVGRDEARQRLGQAVDRLELSLRGLAHVRSTDPASPLYGKPLSLDFDTGAAVRAGAQSWNVAGSPAWGKLFLNDEAPCVGPEATVVSGQSPGATRAWIAADSAKAVFRTGHFFLEHKAVCRKGTALVGLDALASALRKLCSAQKERDPWCAGGKAGGAEPDGTQAGSGPVGELLDESADKPRVQKELAQMREAYRQQSLEVCRKTLQGIEACFAGQGCALSLPADVSPRQCETIPPRPSYGKLRLSSGKGCNSECQRRIDEEDNREYQASMAQWNRKYGELAGICKTYLEGRRQIQACRKDKQAACNPRGFEKVEDCVEDRIKSSAPSEDDARAALKKQWQQKKSAPASAPATNFLD